MTAVEFLKTLVLGSIVGNFTGYWLVVPPAVHLHSRRSLKRASIAALSSQVRREAEIFGFERSNTLTTRIMSLMAMVPVAVVVTLVRGLAAGAVGVYNEIRDILRGEV